MMDLPADLLWHNGKFLGIDWNAWKVIGWLGNATFFSRFFVQWYATEKRKQVVVPTAFWWLSLVGSFLLLCYALFGNRDYVFIFAYAFTWIPYIRNLVIHRRHKDAHLVCPACGLECPPPANYCAQCGAKLAPDAMNPKASRASHLPSRPS
jgi:lipid-A-disaccharide synthase-like uncharacterized protein